MEMFKDQQKQQAEILKELLERNKQSVTPVTHEVLRVRDEHTTTNIFDLTNDLHKTAPRNSVMAEDMVDGK